MEGNFVKSVVQSITTGCRNGPGGDCHWRREYELLKRQFNSYKENTSKEIERLSMTEAKFVSLEKNMKVFQKSKEAEIDELKRLNERFKMEIPFAHKRGYDGAKDQFEGVIEFLKRSTSTAEEEAREYSKKYELLLKAFERSTLENETTREMLESKNEVLEIDVAALKEKVEEGETEFQIMKKKAHEEYLELNQKNLELKAQTIAVRMELSYIQKENSKLMNANDDLKKQTAHLKSRETDLMKKHDQELSAFRLKAASLMSERISDFESQLTFTRSKFSDVVALLKSQIERIESCLKSTTAVSKSGRREGKERELLKDLLSSLHRIEEEQKVAEESKETFLTEIFALVETLRTFNKDLSQACKNIVHVFGQLSETLGLRLKNKDSALFDNLLLLKQTESEAENMDKKSFAVFELKTQTSVLKELVENLKSWKESLLGQQARLLNRKDKLQGLLEEERMERSKEKEEATRKMRIYKSLISKLRKRLAVATKSVESGYVKPSGQGAEKDVTPDFAARMAEFRVMLDTAEKEVEGASVLEKEDE